MRKDNDYSPRIHDLAKKYNLRVKKECVNCPDSFDFICPTRSRKWPHDHIYDGGSWFGLALRRDTKKQLTWELTNLKKLGAILIVKQMGDTEGNFIIKNEEAIPVIASRLKIVKTNKAKNGFKPVREALVALE